MSKRTATSQPVGAPTPKRASITVNADSNVTPDFQAVVGWLEQSIPLDFIGTASLSALLAHVTVHCLTSEEVFEDMRPNDQWLYDIEQYVDMFDDVAITPPPAPHIRDVIISLQARVRGVIARARVIPALLSPDPTDLRQAVLFCANGCK
jgi:hypothetical protein